MTQRDQQPTTSQAAARGPRMIDRNGQRAGATISAVALIAAFLTGWEYIAPVMAVVMAIGVIFGLRYSPLGATYRLGKRALGLKVPVDPEEEAPPRFAQGTGFAFMALAMIGFYLVESAVLGWGAVLAMAAAQLLLGVTGICLACEFYLVGRRLRRKVTA